MTRLTPLSAQRRLRQGFSLAEVLIAMGVLSILLIGVTSATITSTRMLYRIMADADINQEIRFVEGQLARDVREALSVSMGGDNQLRITTADGVIDYYTRKGKDGEIELVREDEAGGSEHIILQDIFRVSFAVPAYSVTVVEMTVSAYVHVGTTASVERTYFSRFTSRVSRL